MELLEELLHSWLEAFEKAPSMPESGAALRGVRSPRLAKRIAEAFLRHHRVGDFNEELRLEMAICGAEASRGL